MYWSEEPWGPLRDNMHAAMIVTELLRPHLKEGATLNMADYLLRPKEDRDAIARGRLLSALSAMADRPTRRIRRKKP
jgi:hypothetical protein